MTLLQIKEVVDVAKITDFSAMGIMGVVIIGLAWFVYFLLKKIDKKDIIIMDVTEKYFTVSTELINLIKGNRNV